MTHPRTSWIGLDIGGANLKAVIKQEFNKDYTQVPVHQLREQLQAAQAKSAE